MLSTGSMYPAHLRSPSPAFQNLCGSPRPEHHRLPWPREPGRLPRTPVADTAPLHRERLLLVVDVHDGTGPRLDDVLHLQAVAARARHPPQEREALPGAVIYGVRVGAGARASGVRACGHLSAACPRRRPNSSWRPPPQAA